MKKIILTGGGTAGHVMPNIALLPYLADFEVHYIGGNGIEKTLVSKRKDVIYHEIPCVKFVRKKFFANLLIPVKLFVSVRCAKKAIKRISPDVIFGKGGYVSLPVALAKGKTPLVIHESDLSLGLANRLIVKKCAYVCTSFDVTAKEIGGIYTGALIRKELFSGKRTTPYPTLLVMGGSLGSEAINKCVRDALDELTKKFYVVHITGKGNLCGIKQNKYLELEFADNMADIYAGADLIVMRGGANSLFEAVALNKKALVIPLPKGTSRGDQVENAAYFQSKGLVKTLPQDELTPERLVSETDALARFVPKKFDVVGTEKVARLLVDLCSKKS